MNSEERTPKSSPTPDEGTGRATSERSAGRAIQMTPDFYRCRDAGRVCGQILFQADVGQERWSINGDLVQDVFTGNVFFEDLRAPTFLHCPVLGTRGEGRSAVFVIDCSIAANCAGIGCGPSQWHNIGPVTLPVSYLLP